MPRQPEFRSMASAENLKCALSCHDRIKTGSYLYSICQTPGRCDPELSFGWKPRFADLGSDKVGHRQWHRQGAVLRSVGTPSASPAGLDGAPWIGAEGL